MYKTVRKGDASLQYTILPQTDQTASNGALSVPPKRTAVTKYATAVVMMLIIIAFTAASLINQTYFTGTILGLPRKFYQASITVTGPNVTNIVKERYKTLSPTVTSRTEELHTKDSQKVALHATIKAVEETEPKTTEIETESLFILKNLFRTTTTVATSIKPTTSLPTKSSTATSISTLRSSTTTFVPVHLKMSKMPKVTLKLRKSDTIPQMYMKAGIASYKKGNITTSVLAHGLSLEGLIFKTPEGTIKPWTPCSPGSHSYFNWSRSAIVHFVLAVLGTLAVTSLVVLYCIQRKALKQQRRNIEEPDTDHTEGDNSTLLNAENDEVDEKE